jgi:hypothetical protein
LPLTGAGYAAGMERNVIRRALVAAAAATAVLLTGAAACGNDSGPGVPSQGESGDVDRDFGTGGEGGAGPEGAGEPGEGGAGDEIGGGG